jgi:hypothetical protein
LKILFRTAFIALWLMNAQSFASPFDPMIDNAAARHGVNRLVLRAITEQESQKNPWTFNADGEGFKFQSKQQAVAALWAINQSPWMAKVVPSPGAGPMVRRFFTTANAAQAFINGYQRSLGQQGKLPLIQRSDAGKEVNKGQARVRMLWMYNTDIGIAQVNYRFHARDIRSVQYWFDPAFNLDYAARLLAKHKAKYGDDLTAAGYYHSGTDEFRRAYMKAIIPLYKKELANEGISYSGR